MKKLLQLLNGYERVIGTDRVWGGAIDDGAFFCTRKSKKGNLIVQHSSEDEAILQIISKKFGFIQWLVVNDKIKRKIKLVIKYFRCNDYGELRDEDRYNEVESLLMRLAISDDPIEFLVSILK